MNNTTDMEVKLNIGYEQLLAIINQLPTEEVSKLKVEIDNMLNNDHSAASNDWVVLLADGPVMSDEQYQTFEENRKYFNQWRES